MGEGGVGPVSEPAPAKVNLFLRVRGRRADGYHGIETLILPLTLADGVRASVREEGFTLSIVGETVAGVPSGDENLVLRAARTLAAEAGVDRGADLLLAKRIPVAAGLGGGSTDAAAALRALDRLWGLRLGPARLVEVGSRIGSDVPALVPGGPALVRGRGDLVQEVGVPRLWWVLLVGEPGIAAGEAYGWWDLSDGPTGPEPSDVVEAAAAGDVERLAGLLFNDLEPPVRARRPDVVEAGARLRAAGALAVILCGSGPTLAGLCGDGAHAQDVAEGVGGRAVATLTGLGGPGGDSEWDDEPRSGVV